MPSSVGDAKPTFDEDLARGEALMKNNTLVIRMCLYGFLKNLKFFEPYIVAVLLKWGLSLTLVGVLISVEKVTCYLAELPTGYLADRVGARKTLCSCFVFYIASFVCYYFGETHFAVLVMAAICYGLAEALREGTHKAMVFLWLEKHDLLTLKSFLNGKTRSYSLLGSALAAVGGCVLTLTLDADRGIFLFSIPPYLLDLLIIWSYPAYMDTHGEEKASAPKKKETKEKKEGKSFTDDMRALCTVMKTPEMRRIVLSRSLFGAMHRLFKDFVQPVVIVFGPTMANSWFNEEWSPNAEAVVLGALYCVFYLCSAPASRKAYLMPQKACCRRTCTCRCSRREVGDGHGSGISDGKPGMDKHVMDGLFDSYGLCVAMVGVCMVIGGGFSPIALLLYITLYVLYNLMMPTSAAAISDLAGKRLRATMLSADSLLQTLSVAVLAPLAGLLVDHSSLQTMFLVFSLALLCLNRVFLAERSLTHGCAHDGHSGAAGVRVTPDTHGEEGRLAELDQLALLQAPAPDTTVSAEIDQHLEMW